MNSPKAKTLLPSDRFVEEVRKHGHGSNSFLTLYSGYLRFESPISDTPGSIPYVDTGNAWVAAAEPLCEEKHSTALIDAFRKEAEKNGKHAFMLPVSESLAEKAKSVGFDAVMIGSEPIFDLTIYSPDFSRFHSAKHLRRIGARLSALNHDELTLRHKSECEEIHAEWMAERRMAPLAFLNQINPWELGSYKRYFLLHHKGLCLGFLAAVPIWSTRGWYLVDLLKRPNAPPGTSEMILLEAMRILKSEGYQWVSLGLSPLSRLNYLAPEKRKAHRLLYRVLGQFYQHGNTFYRFRPLFEFKQKLHPTDYPERYLLASSGALGPRGVLSLLHAFVPGGILRMIGSGLKLGLKPRRLIPSFAAMLRKDILPRPLPDNGGELLRRARVTLGVAALCAWAFPFSHLRGLYSFGWDHLLANPLQAFFISPFLHLSVLHLTTNLLMLFSGTLLFELLAGSRMALAAFSTAALLSNAVTLALLRTFIDSPRWLAFHDVGASLGIFGCLGGLCVLFQKRYWIALALLAMTVFVTFEERDWMSMDHVVAFVMGYLFVRWFFLGSNSRGWRITTVAAAAILATALPHSARADDANSRMSHDSWELLPESRHQQYQVYAFFTDEQSSLLYRTAGRAWGEVGGAFALLQANHWGENWKSKPQLVFIASANAGYRINAASAGVFTDTIDARIGFNVEAEPVEGHRIFVGFMHMSGHISDDVPDTDLIGSNFGWEEIRIRYIYSGLEKFRFGGTLSPNYSADPPAKVFSADQFAEWFPWGLSSDRHHGSWYVSGGLEEYGADKVRFTGQIQAGILFGNHDRPVHEPSLRFAVGYYNGVDPRLKYMAFKDVTTQFGYAGVFIDL